eukprot:TRINITY_DN35432_c0_g1_i1.p2 TRINITY_DN35432_c0_g1~~TRINITY_DN35432_c0_g1_i1.p2  ORF type:complete len:214 (-),score=54.96 TRINITY_DN35432_c0_g1_i1:937-1578(-)
MTRFIVLTFLFLGWGFWEMSGGSDFVPESGAPQMAASAEVGGTELVTRASTMSSEIALNTASSDTMQIVRASLATAPGEPAAADAVATQAAYEAPSTNEGIPMGDEVYMFESLVEGAPTVADILPESEIAVIMPQGSSRDEAPVADASAVSLRQVAGSRVNMRSGPSTSFGVVTTLDGGTEVEVFEVEGGWARLRSIATGDEGWMAERLLTDG